MSVAVYALRKYSKYSTAHSGCWNATDHTLNCIYSLETLSPQQQLHLPPHPKRHAVAPGDSSGFPAHRTEAPYPCPHDSDCKLHFQAQGLFFFPKNGILGVLLASSFYNEKGLVFCSHVL